ncbi:hypothetical protein HanIR_Chr16g0797911 [Helianthus annuus]|nr:hypothetical protein HanIR_Chr16g0797911 [Helianthus annuus]
MVLDIKSQDLTCCLPDLKVFFGDPHSTKRTIHRESRETCYRRPVWCHKIRLFVVILVLRHILAGLGGPTIGFDNRECHILFLCVCIYMLHFFVIL